MDASVDRNARTPSHAPDRRAPGLAATAHTAARLRGVLSAALVIVASFVAACGGTREDADADASNRAAAGAANWNFEAGDLSGWRTLSAGSGTWHVYRDGVTPPDPTDSDRESPFAVPDPPEGKFAAVTDMSAPGRRILYRDIDVTSGQVLRFTVFYDNDVVGEFSTPRTLEFKGLGPNQQLRIDVIDPSAPVDAMHERAVLATVFRTASGDPARIAPTTKTFDLSRWAGSTIRLRFAQVDNRGPLRAGIDDVRLERARP